MKTKSFKKLIDRLTGFICSRFGVKDTVNNVIAGSALGVIGNVARWGNDNQIQVLAGESKLLQCLVKILCSKSKKLVMESCMILSNIAARRNAWIQLMHEVKLVDPLCNLLAYSTHDSDVKMEAAWVIFNGIYGNIDRERDEYLRNDDQVEIE